MSIAAVMLSGCATGSSPELAKMDALNKSIPVCDGEVDCKAKWEAAQLWVVHNAAYKIQIMSDGVCKSNCVNISSS
jgi:hypothetical protein